MQECIIEGCSKRVLARGWCSKHYARWDRTRSTDDTEVSRKRGEMLKYLIDHMWDDCPKWPFSRSSGYAQLYYKGQPRGGHQVVCELVHGPKPSSRHHASHGCGKGREGCFGANCISWKTPKDNEADKLLHGTSNRGERHGMARFTEAEIREIKRLKDKESSCAVAERFRTDNMYVTSIWRGERWGHVQ